MYADLLIDGKPQNLDLKLRNGFGSPLPAAGAESHAGYSSVAGLRSGYTGKTSQSGTVNVVVTGQDVIADGKYSRALSC